jgi:hypothetical protein
MDEILLVFFIIIDIILIAGLVWLTVEHKKLRRDYLILSENVRRNNQDIGGLSSAAIFVDSRIFGNKTELNSVIDKIEGIEDDLNSPKESANVLYQNAIETMPIEDDLGVQTQESGTTSREEEELLMRLRGMSNTVR